MALSEKKYGVFISYSHLDAKYVSPIVKLISTMRNDLVFQDTVSLRAGKQWKTQLVAALEEADILIIFWCQHAAASSEVREEYERAIISKKDILPVLLDESILNPPLSEYQWINFREVVAHSNKKSNRIKLSLKIIIPIIIIALASTFYFSTPSSLSKSVGSMETNHSIISDTSMVSSGNNASEEVKTSAPHSDTTNHRNKISAISVKEGNSRHKHGQTHRGRETMEYETKASNKEGIDTIMSSRINESSPDETTSYSLNKLEEEKYSKDESIYLFISSIIICAILFFAINFEIKDRRKRKIEREINRNSTIIKDQIAKELNQRFPIES